MRRQPPSLVQTDSRLARALTDAEEAALLDPACVGALCATSAEGAADAAAIAAHICWESIDATRAWSAALFDVSRLHSGCVGP
jgi:hypothetical protein